MNNDRELLQQALDALQGNWRTDESDKAIEALRARLAQPDVPETAFGETEPVAWISHNAGLYHGKPDESLNPLPLYTAPPQREWVGLTEEERLEILAVGGEAAVLYVTEAKLKEKNNGCS